MNTDIIKVGAFLVVITIILSVFTYSNGLSDNARPSDKVTVTVYKHNLNIDSPEIKQMISHNWKYLNESKGGIFLVYNTENKITNNGIGFLQDQTLGLTPSASAFANWIALTTDSAAPAYTDTTCTSEITTNGLQRVQGTLVKGTPSAGSSISTNTKTFTATGTFTAVDKACLFTASSGGTLVADTLFSAVNMASGDQLTINWQITITY